MSTIIKYLIIILISILVGWNIRISTNDNWCNNNICPPPEYIERGDNNGKDNK